MGTRWPLPLRQAFTLIELLVVLAIIAILASLLLPPLTRSKAKARATTCKNHFRQIGIGLHLHVDDTGGYPPYFENVAPNRVENCLTLIPPYVTGRSQLAAVGTPTTNHIVNFGHRLRHSEKAA
jgi:prepilin-type N-terminal cleavage/methylation domain-containing protein